MKLFAYPLILLGSALACPCVAAEPRTPNILFCIADDASPHLGAYGYDWVATPNIDRLAAGGIVFDQAYTPTAKCAPSRAAILTGRNPWQLEEGANHQSYFPANYKVFTEALTDAGMYVGAQGKFWGPGSAKTKDGQERTFGLVTADEEKHKEDQSTAFREFLRQRPKDKPFFYWFGSGHPHRSYTLDSGIAAGKKTSDIEHVPGFWPDTDVVRRDMLDYAIEVEMYDRQVGSLIKVLEETREIDNTLVVVTSDHGMPFPRVKGHNYDASNRVPLIAYWPAGIQNPGRRFQKTVSLIELAPTFLEVMKVSPADSGMAAITGASITDIFADQPRRERSFVILGRERNDVWARPGTEFGLGYPVRGIRQDRWLYLHNFAPDRWPCGNVELGLLDTDASPTKKLIETSGSGNKFWEFCFGKRPQEELFDVVADPDCTRNLIDHPEHRKIAMQLQRELFDELKKQDDPRILGKGDVFDNYPSAKGRATAKDKNKSNKKADTKKGKANAS